VSIKTGDRIKLTIHDIAFGGEGVGRIDEFVVFVPFVITGETVEAEVTEVKKNFARARLLRVKRRPPTGWRRGAGILHAAADANTSIWPMRGNWK
jgi:tRNA/tmRNA/rRNA uracil-C5-methylase (TrmA/RlmC/RlmD family)